MATGACGINCNICRLNLLGKCGTCGPGKSEEGLRKWKTQKRLLGAPCPVLDCAVSRSLDFCPRDCDEFPCPIFTAGPYPFSRGFLDMQKRRRSESTHGQSPVGGQVRVPEEYWIELEKRKIKEICTNSLTREYLPSGLILPFLNKDILIDRTRRCLCIKMRDNWTPFEHRLLELLCLVYVLSAAPSGLSGLMTAPQELKCGHFFKGPHLLKSLPVLERYGHDTGGFERSALKMGGNAIDLADLAFRFLAFPKVPVYYLLWKGDEEFQPNLSILFDRSIEEHLAADAIWGLVSLISDFLILGCGVRLS